MNIPIKTPSLDGVLDRYPNVSVSDARATIAHRIDRVSEMGERLLITRHGTPIAAIVCMPDLLSLEASDAKAQAALTWPEAGIGEIEGSPLGSTPDATSEDDLVEVELEELVRKTEAAARHNPKLRQVMSDVIDMTTSEEDEKPREQAL